MSQVDQLVQKATEGIQARPILPFGTTLRLGDVGVVGRSQNWEPRGTAGSLLATRVGRSNEGSRANWSITSGNEVGISALARGEASTLFPKAPKASARVEISFGSAESFLLSVRDLHVLTLANPAALITAMLKAFGRGTWRREYVLVYQLVIPRYSLILLSKHADSSFLLTAKAKAAVQGGSADLAGNVRLTYQNKDAVNLDAGRQPLFFNGYRVKPDWWGKKGTVETLGLRDEDPEDVLFDRI